MSDLKSDYEGLGHVQSERLPALDLPRNWQEDYPHENGQYLCRCYECHRTFWGYKRRLECRECAEKRKNPPAGLKG